MNPSNECFELICYQKQIHFKKTFTNKRQNNTLQYLLGPKMKWKLLTNWPPFFVAHSNRMQTRKWYCQRGDHAGVTGPVWSCHHSNMWWQSKVTQYTTWQLVTNCQLPFANTGHSGGKPVRHPGSWVRQIKLNVACDLSPYFNNKLWNWGIYSPFSYTEALYNA